MNDTNANNNEMNRAETLVMRNDVSSMPLLYEFIEGLCERYGYPMEMGMELQLALEEALVNVINYAFPNDDTAHDIRLTFSQKGDILSFTIEDDGVPFDPTQHQEVDIDAPIEERQVGGLGIHLVRTIMDRMEYRREADHNVLMLEKRLASNY